MKAEPLQINATAWSAAPSNDAKTLFVGTSAGVSVIDWSHRSLMLEWHLPNGPFVVMPMTDSLGVFAIGVDHIIHQLNVGVDQPQSSRIIDEGPGDIPAHSDYFLDEQLLAISESSA